MRYIDTESDRPRWRITANRRFLPTLQAGVEYNPVVGEVVPLATWFILTETERRPALFLGTSSDRIGSPEGTQGYYLTAAKRLHRVPVSPYVGLHYSEWEEKILVPFGADVDLGSGYSLRPMYDGARTHLLALKAWDHASVTLIWAWLEQFGAAVAVGF
jgi:hypothetical protein